MAKILLVEDDNDLAETVVAWLSDNGFEVERLDDGKAGLDKLSGAAFDAAIIDWRLPSLEGTEICRLYREGGGNTPIIMLTGNKRLDDKLTGFESGVDDYLVKPFDLRELTMRLEALLKRPRKTGEQ